MSPQATLGRAQFLGCAASAAHTSGRCHFTLTGGVSNSSQATAVTVALNQGYKRACMLLWEIVENFTG